MSMNTTPITIKVENFYDTGWRNARSAIEKQLNMDLMGASIEELKELRSLRRYLGGNYNNQINKNLYINDDNDRVTMLMNADRFYINTKTEWRGDNLKVAAIRIVDQEPINMPTLLTLPTNIISIVAVYITFTGQSSEWPGEKISINGVNYPIEKNGEQLIWLNTTNNTKISNLSIGFNISRCWLSNVTVITEDSLEREKSIYGGWLQSIGDEEKKWLIRRKAMIDETLGRNMDTIIKGKFNDKNKFFTIRSLKQDPKPVTLYRKHLEAKLSSPLDYGIHPGLANLNWSLRFYVRNDKISGSGGGINVPTDLMDVTPTLEGSFYTRDKLSIQNFNYLLLAAIRNNSTDYIKQWTEWICVWLNKYNTVYNKISNNNVNQNNLIDDIEQELVNDVITYFRYIACLIQFYPKLWSAIPDTLLVQIPLHLADRYVTNYLSYCRTDPCNWRFCTAPLLLSASFLLDEFSISNYFWTRALEEIEITNYFLILPDGSQVQQDPWYNFMYFSHASCLDLLTARRSANYFIQTEQMSIFNEGKYDKMITNNIPNVSNFLSSLIQYNFQYPQGMRMDGRNVLGSIYYGSGITSGPANYINMLDNNGSTTKSYVYPYFGLTLSKTPNSYVTLFNSPHPSANGAYRSRRNNNTVTMSLSDNDYIRTSENNRYEYIETPVLLVRNGITYQQDFHIGIQRDTNMSTRHRGFRVSSWNIEGDNGNLNSTSNTNSSPIKYILSDEYDIFDSTYSGTWTDRSNTSDIINVGDKSIIEDYHRRLVLHHKTLDILIIVDYVISLSLNGVTILIFP